MANAEYQAQSDALLTAVEWIQNMLLGTLATTMAIVAVASVGYLTLSGRIHLRRGATIIAGCFVLFGAPSIARGLQAAAGAPNIGYPIAPQAEIAPLIPATVVPPAAPPFDPYAGASVPKR